MGRPRGSKNVPAVRTDAIRRAWEIASNYGNEDELMIARAAFALRIARPQLAQPLADILAAVDTREAYVAHAIFAHARAAKAGFTDSPRWGRANREHRLRLALEAANLRKLAKTGRPLTRVKDYIDYRGPDAPGKNLIYDHYGSFAVALAQLGISAVAQPRAMSAKPQGRPTGRNTMTSEQAVRAVATAIEKSGGHPLSYDGFNASRDIVAPNTPHANSLVQAFKRGGWAELRAAAYKLIADSGDRNLYPNALAYLDLVAAAQRRQSDRSKGT